jgi:hypothetical protein
MSLKEKNSEMLKKSSVDASDEPVNEDVTIIKTYLSRAFIKNYTGFPDLEAFLNSGGFTAKTQLDYQSIPEVALDLLVDKNSKFSTWAEMVSASCDFNFENQMKGIKFS